MPRKPPPIQGPRVPQKPKTLLEDTEILVQKMVRNARRSRVVIGTDKEGNPTRKFLPPDSGDMARAVKAALDFVAVKNKIDPPDEGESEFERLQREYHNGQGRRDASPAEDANDADPRTRATH
ncbi:MAG TPA: hypothetical protein VF835_01070 [Rhizomicrobium sp.]